MKRVQVTKAFEIPVKRSQMLSLNVRSKVRSRLSGSINLLENHVSDGRMPYLQSVQGCQGPFSAFASCMVEAQLSKRG